MAALLGEGAVRSGGLIERDEAGDVDKLWMGMGPECHGKRLVLYPGGSQEPCWKF